MTLTKEDFNKAWKEQSGRWYYSSKINYILSREVEILQSLKLKELIEERWGELMDVPNIENNKIAIELQEMMEKSKK